MIMLTNLCETPYHGYYQYFSRNISLSPISIIYHLSNISTQHPTRFPLLSMHKLPHLRGRGDGRLVHSHRQMKRFVTDDLGGEGNSGVLLLAYQRIHIQDNPSDRYRRMPSNKLCRRMRYGLQVVSPLSWVLSVSTPHRTKGRHPYQHTLVHVPAYIANDSNSVRAV